jgi:Na+/melibiose symporter-like transporter
LLSLNYSILNRLLIFLLIIIIVVIILDNINSIYKYFLVEYILSVAELATASDL